MRTKFVIVIWTVFLTVMGIYILNPRTVDDITNVKLEESLKPTITLVQKQTRGDENGVSKSTSDFETSKEVIEYFQTFVFRKPFRVNYDTIDSVGPSYDIIIQDSTGEIFRACVAGDKFVSMNDSKGVWRNFVPKDDNSFDFEYFDSLYASLS